MSDIHLTHGDDYATLLTAHERYVGGGRCGFIDGRGTWCGSQAHNGPHWAIRALPNDNYSFEYLRGTDHQPA